jgi:hypothetical protein
VADGANGATVKVALLLVTALSEHEIDDAPAVTPVEIPVEAIVATLVLEEAHVTDDVMLAVEVSL